MTLEADEYRYDGTVHEPAVTVNVKGCGDYEGEAYASFSIRNVLGDTDGNGKVEITDVTLIQRRLTGIDVPDPERFDLVGDVTGSGTLEILDASMIRRRLAGLNTDPYPIGSLMD